MWVHCVSVPDGEGQGKGGGIQELWDEAMCGWVYKNCKDAAIKCRHYNG